MSQPDEAGIPISQDDTLSGSDDPKRPAEPYCKICGCEFSRKIALLGLFNCPKCGTPHRIGC